MVSCFGLDRTSRLGTVHYDWENTELEQGAAGQVESLVLSD